MAERNKVPIVDAFVMLYNYARVRVVEQIRAVAFIILYLVAFQTLVLGVPLSDAFSLAGGIALVVFGLAFFMEGLLLGLMPLGERVGVKLPTRVGIIIIAIFGLFLGFGATLAEPAISALKLAGSNVMAWDSPLLYMLLERLTQPLVLSIGGGVGVAVALGMFRFYYNLSIKPFILVLVPLVLALSLFYSFDDNLKVIIGLAWDSGVVTTGAVTVPLVLALGIGVSRASNKGKSSDSGGGFGIILLASLFPILAVLTLGMFANSKAPQASTEAVFFSPEYRENALFLFDDEDALKKHAFTHGSETGRRAFYGNDEVAYHKGLLSLTEGSEVLLKTIGEMSLADWIISKASDNERDFLKSVDLSKNNTIFQTPVTQVLKTEFFAGMQAVIPLSIFLAIVLILFLREKLRYRDEVALGIVFTLIGMTLLTSGIQLGLAALGGEVGGQFPRAFAKQEKFVDRIVIDNFNEDVVFKGTTTWRKRLDADSQESSVAKSFMPQDNCEISIMAEEDRIDELREACLQVGATGATTSRVIPIVTEGGTEVNATMVRSAISVPANITCKVVDVLLEASTIDKDKTERIHILDSPAAYVHSL